MQKTYETYKDSGIEWIGVVPSHWSICQFKRLHCGSNVGESIDKQYWINDNQGYIFYTAGIKPINTNYINFPKEKYTKENDLLLARNGTPYVYLPAINAVYTDHIIRVSIKSIADKKYIYYALSKAISNEVVDTVSIATWSASLWNAQYLPIPPFSEQQAIAEYLDKKCSKIDSLVAELEQQVTDLGTMKKAEISRVVTKGLNPDAPLKDSGIEWMGNVPNHWNVQPLKRALLDKMMYGANESAESDNKEYPRYIRITDIAESGELKEETFKSLPPDKAQGYMLKKGDVLFARSGATVGKTFLYNLDEPACFAGYLIKAECDKELLSPAYLMYYTKSNGYDNWKNSVFAQATIQNIGADKYSLLPITLPSISEQQTIVKHLDTYCAKVDATVKELQYQIADLKLYKQSIISEAVTGKIKVID